jgi:hypothetical protein
MDPFVIHIQADGFLAKQMAASSVSILLLLPE